LPIQSPLKLKKKEIIKIENELPEDGPYRPKNVVMIQV
jgi:hypothetical protein